MFKKQLNIKLIILVNLCLLLLFFSTSYASSVKVLLCEHPTVKVLEKDFSEFEDKTGIKLIIDIMPESGEISRGMLALSGRTGEYDVIMSYGARAVMFAPPGWIEPLDGFIEKESEDFDYNDFLPKLMSVLTVENKVYGLPFVADTNILYYNKKIFQEVGLSGPPKTVQQIEEYAEKIKNKGYDGFALRGEGYSSVFPWIMLRKLYGVEKFLDENMEPTFDTEASILATKLWKNLLSKYGPRGVAQYGWAEVKQDFQQGKVGMIMDTSMWAVDFEDPSKSNVAGEVGYAHIPGPGDNYNVTSCWAFYIAADAQNKEEAWEFIRWTTSKELQLKQALRGERGEASRLSVWNNQEFKSIYNSEWVEATNESFAHADPFYMTIIPEISEVRTKLGIQLSAILSGQKTAEEGLHQAAKEGREILEDAGYYTTKP